MSARAFVSCSEEEDAATSHLSVAQASTVSLGEDRRRSGRPENSCLFFSYKKAKLHFTAANPALTLYFLPTSAYLTCILCYICFLALHPGNTLYYRSAKLHSAVPSTNLSSHKNLIVPEDSLCQTTGP